MYTPHQLAAMRAHPDRHRVLAAILDAHDALLHPTSRSREVMRRIRGGVLEVLFDAAMPPIGGMAPGLNPVILGGQGVLGNPRTTPDQIHNLMFSTVHEGVHHLDIAAGRCLPGAAATVEQRFFTELHAYTAEYQLARANGLLHVLGPEFRGARHLDDISAGVLTVESYLVFALRQLPGVEQSVVRRVGIMFPTVPRRTP